MKKHFLLTLFLFLLIISIVLFILKSFPDPKERHLKHHENKFENSQSIKQIKNSNKKMNPQQKTRKEKKVKEKFDPYKYHPCEVINFFVKSKKDPGLYLKNTFGSYYKKYKDLEIIEIQNQKDVYQIVQDIDMMKDLMPLFLAQKENLFSNIKSQNKSIQQEASAQIQSMYSVFKDDIDFQSNFATRKAYKQFQQGNFETSLKTLFYNLDSDTSIHARTVESLLTTARTPQDLALSLIFIQRLPTTNITFIKTLRKKLPQAKYDDMFKLIRHTLFQHLKPQFNIFFHQNKFFEIGSNIAPMNPDSKMYQEAKSTNEKRNKTLAHILNIETCDDRIFIDYCDKNCYRQ